MAINAPVVGSRNGGVVADGVFVRFRGLNEEPNGIFGKS